MDVRSRLNSQQQLYLDLAQSHFAHDLQQSDRDALTKAAGKAQTHVLVGGLVGSALGLGLAWRGRIGIHRAFQAIKQAPKPAEVIMESGEHVRIPKDAFQRQLSEPGPFATFFSTFLLSTVGLLFGTNIALLTGASSARSIITKEADVDRLKAAYRGFRIDLLKKELDSLERGEDVDSSLGLGPFGV